MKEIGKCVTEVPDGFYCIKDGVVYALEVAPIGGRTITIPPIKISDDLIQHVGYTPEICGYEK